MLTCSLAIVAPSNLRPKIEYCALAASAKGWADSKTDLNLSLSIVLKNVDGVSAWPTTAIANKYKTDVPVKMCKM